MIWIIGRSCRQLNVERKAEVIMGGMEGWISSLLHTGRQRMGAI